MQGHYVCVCVWHNIKFYNSFYYSLWSWRIHPFTHWVQQTGKLLPATQWVQQYGSAPTAPQQDAGQLTTWVSNMDKNAGSTSEAAWSLYGAMPNSWACCQLASRAWIWLEFPSQGENTHFHLKSHRNIHSHRRSLWLLGWVGLQLFF